MASRRYGKGIGQLVRHTQAIAVALGHRDIDTRLHSDRVSRLSSRLGQHCGLSGRELSILRLAAAFHDVGKIGIPDSILSKAGILDAGERALMCEHSGIGEDIIRATGVIGANEAARIIRHHHEDWGGSGYPDGLHGSAIPLSSRIIGICDCYDALTSLRPYRVAFRHESVLAIMEAEAGRKFDPDLLEAFFRLIGSEIEPQD